jgi:hypothetical protein
LRKPGERQSALCKPRDRSRITYRERPPLRGEDEVGIFLSIVVFATVLLAVIVVVVATNLE